MKKQILIYGGEGVSKESLSQTIRAFTPLPYPLQVIYPDYLIQASWEETTALLVIPGGADIPYTQALNGPGNQKIRNYVERGGSFFGICAGGYYGGAYVDFATGTPQEVRGPRELSFFPGPVQGPSLAPYQAKSSKGSRAATLLWKGDPPFPPETPLTLFYKGGGHFVEASSHANVKVLALYELGEAAIIECQVGQGKAILSGVHPEYNPHYLNSEDPYLKEIIGHLYRGNPERLALLRCLLERLGISSEER